MIVQQASRDVLVDRIVSLPACHRTTGPRGSVEGQQDPDVHHLGRPQHRQGRSTGLVLGKGGPLGRGRGIGMVVETWETQVVMGGCWACGSFKKFLK